MHGKALAPYGTWDSPVTADLVTAASIAFAELQVDGNRAYWLERRAAQRGRQALVRWTRDGGIADVVPESADVATRVHEYGGGAYAVAAGRIVYSERSDGSVWVIDGAEPRPVIAVAGCRYAGFAIDAARDRVYAVREDHRDRPPTDPENTIVAFSLDPAADPATNVGEIVVAGSDFYLAPRLAPDGGRLAWIAYDHPRMPWDATQLFVARIAGDGSLEEAQTVAGGDGDESIVEAEWTPGGELIFAGDRTEWWNLYAWRDGRAVALAPVDAEIGEPHWVFGRRAFVPIDETHILCAVVREGVSRGRLLSAGTLGDLPFGNVDGAPVPLGAGAIFIATPADTPAAICYAESLDAPARVLRSSSSAALDPGDVSVATSYAIPTAGGETTHITFYPPQNARFTAPEGDRPPLVVMSHGGPTSMHASAFSLGIQWWTSRGFAVVHVNYRGSTGFGRTYRNRLAGAWGVADVEDCISAAAWLGERGWCDPGKIAIRGGSASGMTTLLAVAQSDRFRAATSLYGVMELELLAADTHKFESRYVDGLVGPLPEARAIYAERSPVNHVDTIHVPVLLFQGLDDRAVPPRQAEVMRDALAARGVPVTYEAFAGEGHGFRMAATQRRVLEAELAFYRDVFGLTA